MKNMNGADKNSDERYDISPEAQYREAYESLRQHDRFIWQTPAIAAVIDGALIVSTFATVNIWWVREVVLGCALVLTVVLTFAIIKHRYFSRIEQGALNDLEEKQARGRIQRTSVPNIINRKRYWGEPYYPNCIERSSAHEFFIMGMYVIIGLLLLLLFLNWVIVKTPVDAQSRVSSMPPCTHQSR